MSESYDRYLYRHVDCVQKGLRWMETKIPDIASYEEFILATGNAISHDDSKNFQDEYSAYDAYFYGGNRSHKVVQDFNYAWLHHIHSNPHHWQYWVLINDDPEDGTVALEMPIEYILEMISDWWTFSWLNGDLYEIFKWYEEHKERMILHKKTRELVEHILQRIKEVLDEENE